MLAGAVVQTVSYPFEVVPSPVTTLPLWVAEEKALLNDAEESTRDAVMGADAWMWEEVEDVDGTQRNVGVMMIAAMPMPT